MCWFYYFAIINAYKPGILFMGQANSIAPDVTMQFAVSHLGLSCLLTFIDMKNEILLLMPLKLKVDSPI